MLFLALLRIAPLVVKLNLVVATLPSGDIERVAFFEEDAGVLAVVEHTIVSADVTQRKEQFLKRGRYAWRIEEEHRSVLMTTPGRKTGVVRQAYVLTALKDTSARATDAPRPVEAFHFYTPNRAAAESLRNRLRRALAP